MKEESSSIFVGIPSYRDSEIIPTLSDMFGKCSRKELIFVGICLQEEFEEMNSDMLCEKLMEKGVFSNEQEYHKHVKVDFLEWREAKGPCFARYRVQKLFSGQKYFLSIDSHMRFVERWDEMLVDLLSKCENPDKSIITAYPPPYTLPDNVTNEGRIPFLCFKEFGGDGMLRFAGKLLSAPQNSRVPIECFFWVSGFSFSNSRVLNECPCDPHLPFLFFGEESSMTLRLYTKGWRFFCPPRNVVFHLWERSHRPNFREVHKLSDQIDRDFLQKLSMLRVKYLLHILEEKDKGMLQELAGKEGNDKQVISGVEISSFDARKVLEEISVYGLGSEKTLEEYNQFTGLDLKAKTFTERSKYGGLEKNLFVDDLLDKILMLANFTNK